MQGAGSLEPVPARRSAAGTGSAQRGLALLALAALLVLGAAASGAPSRSTRPRAPRPAAARAPSAERAKSPAARSAPFDSTAGDSFAQPRIYLAWHAPYGSPGARANLDLACGDTSRADTLFLSFKSGRDLPRFFAMWGRLLFHPAAGESLGAFWNYGHEGANQGGIGIQLEPDGSFPGPQPWVHNGGGAVIYESHRDTSNLDMIYAVTTPISGRTHYCYARVLFYHRRCQLPGFRQPVCIEWVEARYSGGGNDFIIAHSPGRWVSVNSADGSVCRPYQGSRQVPALRPK
jgi:hypothetical protein